MIESDLWQQLKKRLDLQLKRLHDAGIVQDFWYAKLSDRSRSGVPDFVTVGKGITAWWEMKHADPKFTLPTLQLMEARKIQRAGGICNFIIFDSSEPLDKSIFIVPARVMSLEMWRENASDEMSGFNYDALARYIREVHDERRP